MNEHIKKFDELYAKMAESSDIKDMHLFGKVMREAMQFIIEHNPAEAEELLEKLTAISYHNFLTKKEAENIIASMEPEPMWSIEKMKRGMAATGAPENEAPCYNEYALYTTISMIASDSGETLAKYAFGKDKSEINDTELFELCYHLAIDKLKDKDKKFDIRKYFDL